MFASPKPSVSTRQAFSLTGFGQERKFSQVPESSRSIALSGPCSTIAHALSASIQSVCALQAVGAHHRLNSASAATTLDTLPQIYEFVFLTSPQGLVDECTNLYYALRS